MAAAARGDGAGVRSGAGRTGTGRAAARHDASRRAPCAGACASVWRRRAYHVLADPADGRLPGAHGEQLSYADTQVPASRAGARRRRRVGLGGAALGAWRSSALGSAPESLPSTRRGAGELGRAEWLSGAERPSRSGLSWLPDPPTCQRSAQALRAELLRDGDELATCVRADRAPTRAEEHISRGARAPERARQAAGAQSRRSARSVAAGM